MKWSETICLAEALQNVHPLGCAPPLDWEPATRRREQAAYERGRREGEKALSEQLIQQRSEMAEVQQGVLDSLRQAVPLVVRDAESALIELALEAARKVVAGMPIEARMLEAAVQEALCQAEDTSEITVQLHPEDLELLRKQDSELLRGSPQTGLLRFAASPEVTRGGCMVQTRFGLIDARREIKIRQLKQALSA